MTYFDLNQDETQQLVDSIKNIQPAFNGCVETRRYIRPRQDCRSIHASDCTSCIFSLFQETELEELEGHKADGSIPLNITNVSNYFGKSQKRKHSLQEPIKLSPTFSISSVIASNSVIFWSMQRVVHHHRTTRREYKWWCSVYYRTKTASFDCTWTAATLLPVASRQTSTDCKDTGGDAAEAGSECAWKQPESGGVRNQRF